MALQSPTGQTPTSGSAARPPGGATSTIFDPTVVRWAHPMIVISLIFAHVGGGGKIAQPVLVGVAVLVLLVVALQLRLHTRDSRVHDTPHMVQPLVTLALIAALALLRDPLPVTILIGVLVFEVWLEVLAGFKRLLPSAIFPALRWSLPSLATFVLMASVRTQQPLGAVVVAFVLSLWLTVLPEPRTWEI